MPHRAAGMRTAAEADPVGVAGDEVDGRDRHTEQSRDDLRKTRLMTLAIRLGANDDLDPPRRCHGDLRALVWRPDRGFDIIREPQPEQLAARLGLPAARRKPV